MASPSHDGGFEEFREFCPAGPAVCDLRGQHSHLRPQRIQLRLCEVRSAAISVSFASTITCRSRALAARSGHLIRDSRDIRHKPQLTTTGTQ